MAQTSDQCPEGPRPRWGFGRGLARGCPRGLGGRQVLPDGQLPSKDVWPSGEHPGMPTLPSFPRLERPAGPPHCSWGCVCCSPSVFCHPLTALFLTSRRGMRAAHGFPPPRPFRGTAASSPHPCAPLVGPRQPEACGPVCLCVYVCVYGQLWTHAAQLTLYPEISFQGTLVSCAHPPLAPGAVNVGF